MTADRTEPLDLPDEDGAGAKPAPRLGRFMGLRRRSLVWIVPAVLLAASLTLFLTDVLRAELERDAWSSGQPLRYTKDVVLRETSSPAEVLSEAIGIAICAGSEVTQKPLTAYVGRSVNILMSVRDIGPERIAAVLTRLSESLREGRASPWEGVRWPSVPKEAAEAIERTLALVEAGEVALPQSLSARFLPAHWKPSPKNAEARSVGDGFTTEWFWPLGDVADEGRQADLPIDVAFAFTLDGRSFDGRQQVAAIVETARPAAALIDRFFKRLSQLQLLVAGVLLPIISFVLARWSKKARPAEAPS